jgi:hypothetical protein
MMFKSTFPASFYKILQRYVHAEFRKRKALMAAKAWISQPHKNVLPSFKKLISLAYRYPQTAYVKQKMEKYAKPL